MALEIRPIKLKDANAYVGQLHRHNTPTNGHKWSLAVYEGPELHGVAIAGQPVARNLDDGMTIEVRRVCTDGTRNACSILYGACARVAKEMGYRRIITYTLISEPGTSLKAAGWKRVCETKGDTWNRPGRQRDVVQYTLFGEIRKYETERKVRWEKVFKGGTT